MLRLLFDLLLLRRGPQDVPYSLPLTRALVAALVGAELLYIVLIDDGQPAGRLLLSLLLLLGIPWLLLVLRARRPRYLQTLAALAGSEWLFTLAFLPLALWQQRLPAVVEGQPLPDAVVSAFLLVLALLGWRIVVRGHIYGQALDWPRLPATVLALVIYIAEVALWRALFSGG